MQTKDQSQNLFNSPFNQQKKLYLWWAGGSHRSTPGFGGGSFPESIPGDRMKSLAQTIQQQTAQQKQSQQPQVMKLICHCSTMHIQIV